MPKHWCRGRVACTPACTSCCGSGQRYKPNLRINQSPVTSAAPFTARCALSAAKVSADNASSVISGGSPSLEVLDDRERDILRVWGCECENQYKIAWMDHARPRSREGGSNYPLCAPVVIPFDPVKMPITIPRPNPQRASTIDLKTPRGLPLHSPLARCLLCRGDLFACVAAIFSGPHRENVDCQLYHKEIARYSESSMYSFLSSAKSGGVSKMPAMESVSSGACLKRIVFTYILFVTELSTIL